MKYNKAKTLKEYLDLLWEDNKREKEAIGVRKEQLMLYCLEKDTEYELTAVCFTRDHTNLKNHVIDDDIQNGTRLGLGLAMNRISLDIDMEPRWNCAEDYDLVGFEGKFPIIKKK